MKMIRPEGIVSILVSSCKYLPFFISIVPLYVNADKKNSSFCFFTFVNQISVCNKFGEFNGKSKL